LVAADVAERAGGHIVPVGQAADDDAAVGDDTAKFAVVDDQYIAVVVLAHGLGGLPDRVPAGRATVWVVISCRTSWAIAGFLHVVRRAWVTRFLTPRTASPDWVARIRWSSSGCHVWPADHDLGGVHRRRCGVQSGGSTVPASGATS
jgi:hypothetical protein